MLQEASVEENCNSYNMCSTCMYFLNAPLAKPKHMPKRFYCFSDQLIELVEFFVVFHFGPI